MNVDYVMRAISDACPEDTIFADESASSKPAFHRWIHPSKPGGYITSAAGGLGFCLPASIGLKLASPERSVVCVIGDGSIMYSVQTLWSAARYSANVLVVVVNNRGYSILKAFRDSVGIGATVPGLDVGNVDYVRVAEGLGVFGETIEKPEDLTSALERGLNAGRPYLLNVMVDAEVPTLLS
jgi:benzoylformate decarboxylase